MLKVEGEDPVINTVPRREKIPRLQYLLKVFQIVFNLKLTFLSYLLGISFTKRDKIMTKVYELTSVSITNKFCPIVN